MVAKGETYNYERFKMSNYELGYFPGPKAGERVDYEHTLTSLDGEPLSLASYAGRWVVIESGSLTCPMFVKNVKPYAKLQEKYPDVEWLVVYVREAHPGERLAPAATLEEKIGYAKRTKTEYHEQRKIAVDDVAGSWHHAWGLLPNMVYVINPDGVVVYRADWSFAERVDAVLAEREKINTNEHIAILGAAPWITVPVALKGGWLALWDLVIVFPKIYYEHFKLDVLTLIDKWRGSPARAGDGS